MTARGIAHRLPFLPAVVLLATTAQATDEIQVYNAQINDPGQWSLQLHGNYIVRGRTEPEFPGGLVPDGSWNGTPELAYGLKDWWEVGAYMPYAIAPGEGFAWGGAKLRTLFVSPHAADRRCFYGINFELSYATDEFDPAHWGSEIRPILGWRSRRLEFILNPILEVPLSGDDRAVTFSPAARLGVILSPAWTVALEHYADYGPLSNFDPLEEQLQELFAVADYSGRKFDADFGIGRGLTSGSDDWTVKYILSFSF